MRKKLAMTILALLFTVALPKPSWAETVLEKVARTGVLTAGTATDSIPLAYVNDQQELVGYSVEMIKLIQAKLSKELGKEIKLELVEVTPQDRIPKLLSGEVDIVCENVSFTWDRDRYIDFSLSYGVTGTKLLVKKGNSLGSAESLKGKRIGAMPETTNEQVIKLVQPQVTMVPVNNVAEGFAALNAGKIDAFAGDSVILEGYRQTLETPDAFAVVPDQPYMREGVACMVPEGNSKFLDAVNYSLVKFMQGVIIGDRTSIETLERWFGPNGIIPVNRDLVVQFFQDVIDTRQQIPVSEKSSP